MNFEEQQEILKKAASRKPEYEFDKTQPEYDSYLCPICSEVMKDPVVHSCGNMFCSECIKSVTSCPVCRKQATKKDFNPAPKLITNKILSFKVICKACKETMTLEAFNASHAKNCSFPCPFGCGEKVDFSNIEKHCKDGKCKNYLLSCPASEPPLSCQWHGHGGAEYDEHVSKCVLVSLIPFATFMIRSFSDINERLCKRDGHSYEGDGMICRYCGHQHRDCETDGHSYEGSKCKYCGSQRHDCETEGHSYEGSKCKYCGSQRRSCGADGHSYEGSKCKYCGFDMYSMTREQLVGRKVRRGRDWKWRNQDGGSGKTGTVTKVDSDPGWVRVTWSNGDDNCYRWGAQGCYDLEVVDP